MNSQYAQILNAFHSLSLYREVVDNDTGRIAFELIEKLAASGGGPQVKKLSADLFAALAARTEASYGPPAGSLWQNHLLDRIAAADNTFTRMAAAGRLDRGGGTGEIVRSAAAADLEIIKTILDLDFPRSLASPGKDRLHLDLISRDLGGENPAPAGGGPRSLIFALKKDLLSMPDWSGAVGVLEDFHRRCGSGLFCRHHALRWDGGNKRLAGIPDPDPIRLDQLVGYDLERGQVVENTERLISGLPASNMLLYGDRGTGKSSTVKALLNEYGPRGLRLVELPKQHLADYQLVLSAIRGPGLKFIIFVDDLSFEESDPEYRTMKSLLDGSLQVNPENAVIYATSNRRHLVREYFDERRMEAGRSDTVQEKLSLSDRFGITVLFVSPDQDLYLKIAENLARQKGIGLPGDQIRQLALDWERWHNSRSGRTARQFVDHLVR